MPLDDFSTFLRSKAFCLKQPYKLDSDDHWMWSLFMICYYRGSSYAVVTRHEKWLKLIKSGQLALFDVSYTPQHAGNGFELQRGLDSWCANKNKKSVC